MGRFGAHIGGTLGAVPTGAQAIGAECVQVFASSPQMWRAPNHQPKVVDTFRAGLADAGVGPVYLHGIYLLNPASLDEAIVHKTIDSVVAHLDWSDKLGAVGVVVHLGSSGKQPVDDAIERVAQNFRAVLARHTGPSLLLLETCAGQGNTIGRTFEQVGYLVRAIADERVAVCLDTCHVFAAGYDFRSDAGLASMVAAFDSTIGLDKLNVLHVNDSKGALGSNVDRHENIGRGQIGEVGFARFLQHPAFCDKPLLLEVPGFAGDGPDAENIDILRRLASVDIDALERASPAPAE